MTTASSPRMAPRRRPKLSDSGAAFALAALAPVTWGATYLVTTEMLPPGRPLLAATMRALPAGLLVLLITKRLPRGEWIWRSAVLGVLNIGAFFALLFVAAYRLPGGVAATLGAIQPLLVTVLAALILGERFRPVAAASGVLGIVGVGLLVLGPEAELDPLGILAATVGAASMSIGVVLTKKWGRPVSLITATGWQLTWGGMLLVPVTLIVEGVPAALTLTNVVGYTWLTLVGTALAYFLWFRGIEKLAVGRVAFAGLLSPLVATSLGWIVLDQSLTPLQLSGVALVLAAVLLPQLGTRASSSSELSDRVAIRGVDQDLPTDSHRRSHTSAA